jgi:hypothetical protein
MMRSGRHAQYFVNSLQVFTNLETSSGIPVWFQASPALIKSKFVTPRRRESGKINELDASVRGHGGLIQHFLGLEQINQWS